MRLIDKNRISLPVPKFRMYFRTEKDPPTIRKIGILGSTGQSFKWTAPEIMQKFR